MRQQAELENGARLAAVGEFSARLAHELRNPISGISAALHNMEAELPDGEERDRVRLIAEEMTRVTGLLNRMLEQGRAHLEGPVEVDPPQLVGDIVRLMRYQMPAHIEIDSVVEAGRCVLPRDTLRQVLINLRITSYNVCYTKLLRAWTPCARSTRNPTWCSSPATWWTWAGPRNTPGCGSCSRR